MFDLKEFFENKRKNILKLNIFENFQKDNTAKPRFLLVVTFLGLVLFLLISGIFPFKDELFSLIYRKPSSLAATVTNLISNGDFENDFTGWTTNGSTWSISTTDAHSGSKAAHLTGTGNLVRNLTGSVGKTYKISFWAKVNTSTT